MLHFRPHWTLAAAGLLGCASLAPAPPAAAGEGKMLRFGEHLAQECSSCHRRDGSNNGIPGILGMKPDEFTTILRFYQTGARTNSAMVSVAKSLDDEQIAALAAYYASLPPPAKTMAPKP